MLVTFHSKTSADVIMFEEHAKRILDILNKNVTRGIITAAELGPAIAKLHAEFRDSKCQLQGEKTQKETEIPGGESEDDLSEQVSAETRAFPLLEMLRAAQSDGS